VSIVGVTAPSMRTPGDKVIRGRWGRSLSGDGLAGVALGRWRCCTCALYGPGPVREAVDRVQVYPRRFTR
jgi:hypothetical protein